MARSYGHLAMHATRTQRAYEPGMISQIVDPPDKLFDEAQAPAEKVAKNSPRALIASKRALWESRETGLTAAMKAGGKHLMDMWNHPDQLEGLKAFAAHARRRGSACQSTSSSPFEGSQPTPATAASSCDGKTSGRGAAVDVVQSLHYVGGWCLR